MMIKLLTQACQPLSELFQRACHADAYPLLFPSSLFGKIQHKVHCTEKYPRMQAHNCLMLDCTEAETPHGNLEYLGLFYTVQLQNGSAAAAVETMLSSL